MWVLYFIVISIIILFVLNKIEKIKKIERENEMLQSYMDTVQNLYQGIYEKVEATRRYRHDLAKHIQTLERILKRRGNVTEINEYVEKQIEKYYALKEFHYCNDEVLDTILTIKKEECEKKQIPIQIKIDDRFYNGIEDVDKTGLILNILDNAIEASERIPENEKKGISFEMKYNKDSIFLLIENYIKKGKKLTFKTQKLIKEEHGLGTKIIEDIVKKYNGTREIMQDEKRWVLQDKIVLKVSGE